MSLTGNFILWNNKSKSQMHETCCSETMSVRNREAEHLLWRLVSVTDRSHNGWKVTSSPMQRSFLRRWPCILGSPPLPPCGSVNFLLRCQVLFLIPRKDLQIWNLHSLKRNCGRSHPMDFSEGLNATSCLSWQYHKSRFSYKVSLLSPADSEKHTDMWKLNSDTI